MRFTVPLAAVIPVAVLALAATWNPVRAPKMIAISDAVNNVVNVYEPGGRQIAQLSDFLSPEGLASDIRGDLYVADTNNNRVQVYAAGLSGTATTLADPGERPVGVDSFHNGALVAVANIRGTSIGRGSISFFANGKRTRTIRSRALTHAYFCAFDANGNLFVDGTGPGGKTVVGEVAAGTQSTFVPLAVGNTIAFPGGIQVTTAGEIAIDDQGSRAIYTYAPPQGGSLGMPVATTTLTGASDPATFAFANGTQDLYTADAGLARAEEYAYPSGGAPLGTVGSGSELVGIAVIPTQYPAR